MMKNKDSRQNGVKTGIPLGDDGVFLRRDPRLDMGEFTPPRPGGKKTIAMLLLKTLVVFLCTVSLYLLYVYSYNGNLNVVRADQVVIEGTHYLDPAEVRSLVQNVFPRNLMQIDIDGLRNRIERLSWVKRVVVRRDFPHQLRIQISERQPVGIARMENLLLFDREGVLLDEYIPSVHKIDRPVLSGLKSPTDPMAGSDNRERISRYLDFLREIDQGGANLSNRLSEVDLNELDDMVVIPLDGAPRIHLGNDQLLKRLNRYFKIIDQARRENGPISEIDMRYDDKVIVRPLGSM